MSTDDKLEEEKEKEIEVETPPVKNDEADEETDAVEEKEDKSFNYVKERVNRAKRQTEESILGKLGVKSVDEAKTALEEIQSIKQSLADKEAQMIMNNKQQQLLETLDKNEVFDSEALMHYVDLEKVELDENGLLVDVDGIVNSLKETKPNFFGVKTKVTDGYSQGQVAKPLTALDKQKQGDTVGAIGDYLKDIMK